MDTDAVGSGPAAAAGQLQPPAFNSTLGNSNADQNPDQANPIQFDSKGFKRLLDSQSLVDCTLACDGGKISAHKIVLSICSSYLNKILLDHPVEHPIIILPELNIEDVRALVHYMYTGELLRCPAGSAGLASSAANLGPGSLHSSSLLKTAAFLSVNSLYDFLNNAAAAAAAASGGPAAHQANQLAAGTQTDQPLAEAGPLSMSSSHSSSSSLSSLASSPGGFLAPTGSLNASVSSAAQAIQTAAASLLGGPFAASLVDNLASLQQPAFAAGVAPGAENLLGFPFSASLASLFPPQQAQQQPQQQTLLQIPNSNQFQPAPELQQQQQITAGAKGHQQTINMSSSNMVVSAGPPGSANGATKSEFQFRCPVCLEFFHTICSFEYHMQKSHNVTSFGCEICHKPFASLRYVLTDHMRRCHGWRPDQQHQQHQQHQQPATQQANQNNPSAGKF